MSYMSFLALQVNAVDTFVLAPMSSKEVIVLYRSQQQISSATTTERDGNDSLRRDDLYSTQSRHAISEERAVLKIRYVVCLEEVPNQAQDTDPGAALAAAIAMYARSAAIPARELVYQLVAKRCRSLLRTDVQELVFENCLIGSSSVKDFTVWNCSEVASPANRLLLLP